jgi:hypothetical protein
VADPIAEQALTNRSHPPPDFAFRLRYVDCQRCLCSFGPRLRLEGVRRTQRVGWRPRRWPMPTAPSPSRHGMSRCGEADRQRTYTHSSDDALRLGVGLGVLMTATTWLWVQAHYRRGVSLMELHCYREAVDALQAAEALEAANRDITRQLRLAREYLALVSTHTCPGPGLRCLTTGLTLLTWTAGRMNAIARAYHSRLSRSRPATCPPRAERSSQHGT